jgi:hypothetical protein
MCRELAGLSAAAVGEAVKAEISAKGRDKVSMDVFIRRCATLNTPVAFKTDST